MQLYLGMHRSAQLFVTFLLSVMIFIVVAPITSAVSSSRRAPVTRFVSPSGDDNNEGTKAAPYRTIQAAINNAATGDTVTLLDGIYSGNGNRDLDFGGKSITVSSANGSEKTVIDCGGVAPQYDAQPGTVAPVRISYNGGVAPKNDVLPSISPIEHRAFYCHRKETSVVISGLTVKNGYGANNNRGSAVEIDAGSTVIIKNSVFRENKSGGLGCCVENEGTLILEKCSFQQNVSKGISVEDFGGGIHNSGKVNLTDCDFEKNESYTGGGGFANSGNATLYKCKFKGNTTDSNGGGLTNRGTLQATDCTFQENTALNGGGGIDSSGDAVLTRCTIFGNKSLQFGGGISASGYHSLILTECTVSDNTAEEDIAGRTADLSNLINGGGGLWINSVKTTITDCLIRNNKCSHGNGGGIAIDGDMERDATLTNCVVTGNMTLAGSGGAINVYGSHKTPLVVRHCTFSGNAAKGDSTQGGAIYNDSGDISLTNCIFWGNTAPNANQVGLGSSGDPVVNATYCDIQGGLSGIGNIKADPLFVNAEKGDFHLKTGSLCIGAGSSAALASPKTTNAPADTSPNKTTTVKTDIEGKARPAKPSMGAYEGAVR